MKVPHGFKSVQRILTIILVLGVSLCMGCSSASADDGPKIIIDPFEHWADAVGWPDHTTLTLTTDGLEAPAQNFTYTAITGPDPTDPQIISAHFDMGTASLNPGTRVTVTDHTTTKSLTISNFMVTGWDIQNDSVMGTATPNAKVTVRADNAPGKDPRWVTADENGNWIALPVGSNSFGVRADIFGYAAEIDNNGNEIRGKWNSQTPWSGNIWVFPEKGIVNLGTSNLGNKYVLTVARSTDLTKVVYSAAGVIDPKANNIAFSTVGFDLWIGDLVTVTDGKQTMSMTVTPPVALDVDVDADIARGKMPANSIVNVMSSAWRYAESDRDGNWIADFHSASRPLPNGMQGSQLPQDLRPGEYGAIAESDIFNNFTIYEWHIPNITPLTGPIDPVPVKEVIQASFVILESSTDQSYTIYWDWGDGKTSENPQQGPSLVTAAHSYTQPGVYTISVSVRDPNGRVSETEHLNHVLVTGPYSRVVTGAGWFSSSPGVSPTNPTLSGQSSFWFLNAHPEWSKHPVGVVFFRLGSLNFLSASFEWRIIQGGQLTLQGTGLVNGHGQYGFQLTALDGESPDGKDQPDAFRMKIWNTATMETVYDSRSTGDPTTGLTRLSGGSVEIR